MIKGEAMQEQKNHRKKRISVGIVVKKIILIFIAILAFVAIFFIESKVPFYLSLVGWLIILAIWLINRPFK